MNNHRATLLKFFVFFFELFDATRNVNKLLGSGKKWMALVAKSDRYLVFRRTRFELIAACALCSNGVKNWMNIFCHGCYP
jgi:hypothetical protein